jgi:hypothetical protein
VKPPTVVQPMVVRLLLLGLGHEMQSLMLERMELGNLQFMMVERVRLGKGGRPPTVVQPMVVRLLLLGLLGKEVQSLMLERLRLGTGGGPPVVDTKIVVRLLLQKSGVLGERSTIVLNRAHTLDAGFFGGAEDGRCRAGLDLCKHGTHRQSHSHGFGSVR